MHRRMYIIKEIIIGNGIERVSTRQIRIEEHISINESPQARAKGCWKILKNAKEKGVNKERICHGGGLCSQ